MKRSIFNVEQLYKNRILLYNTFTTSLVELPENIYNSIFVENDFSLPEVSALFNMGFLIEDSYDEIQAMENIRCDVIKNSSKKIANIIIAPTLECNAHCFY